MRDPREDGCWVSAFVLGSTVRETLQQEGPRVPARVSEEEQVPSPKVPSPNLHSLSWEPSSGEARLLRHAGAEGVRRRREGGRILKKAPLRIHAPGAQRVKSKTPGHYQSLNTRASLPLEDHSPGGRGTNGLVARPPSPHRAPPTSARVNQLGREKGAPCGELSLRTCGSSSPYQSSGNSEQVIGCWVSVYCICKMGFPFPELHTIQDLLSSVSFSTALPGHGPPLRAELVQSLRIRFVPL